MHIPGGRSDSSLGRVVYLISTFLLASILQSNIVAAVPLLESRQTSIDPSVDDPEWNDDPVNGGAPFSSQTVDKYPTLDDCRGKCSVGAGKSLFYSKVGKHEDKPQDFATKNGLSMVRDAYPSGFTDKSTDPSYTGYTKFAQRFSQAFAEKTSGTAYVMLPTDSNTDLSKSVWVNIEKGILTANGGTCNRIVKVDPNDFTKSCVFWDRSGAKDPKMSNCGLENGPVPAPPSAGTYAAGFCGVHVTQYQKNEPNSNPTGDYKLDITIKDANGATIGTDFGADAPGGVGVDVTSALPSVLIVTAQKVDGDAVLFSYAGQSWGSNDQAHHCNFGAYDSGKREGDCGFTC